MIYTSNSGTLWSPISCPINGPTTGFGNNWWVVQGSTIVYSSNNGVNWSNVYTSPHPNYTHITKSKTGSAMWAITSSGGISYTPGSVGIKRISSEIPENYLLNQNFPNPFNPSTNIKYDLPKNSFVKLVVFDALGREVETLVNEKLNAGSYQVDWNASQYPSGVYFYSLITDGFNETKKMIMIK